MNGLTNPTPAMRVSPAFPSLARTAGGLVPRRTEPLAKARDAEEGDDEAIRRSRQPGQRTNLADVREQPTVVHRQAAMLFVKDTSARDNHRVMKRHVINRPNEGVALVRALKVTEKGDSVTDCRRERKSVIPEAKWQKVIEDLKGFGVELQARDNPIAAGRTGATLTYYGTSAVFLNHQVKTKIRMRIRYYVDYVRAGNEAPTDVHRSDKTLHEGFLEIKIKTPRASEENFVDKYRLVVPDDLIAKLVNLDPHSEQFEAQLREFCEAVKGSGADSGAMVNDPELVDVMCSVIKTLAKKSAAFIKPSLVITYERTGKMLREKDYPVPSGTRDETRAKHWPLRLLSSHKKGRSVRPKDIEYQFTVDRRVRAHFPLLPTAGSTSMPVEAHFDSRLGTEIARYPDDVCVVEFKEPKEVAALNRDQRSATHNVLVDVLVRSMKDDIQWGDFDEQVGKYGNFRRRIVGEHQPRKGKNEQISVVF